MEYIIGILLLISFVGLAVYAVRGGNLMMGMLIMGVIWTVLPLIGNTFATNPDFIAAYPGVTDISFVDAITKVFQSGPEGWGSVLVNVVFGAWFGRVLLETGIADALIRKAVELGGDKTDCYMCASVNSDNSYFLYIIWSRCSSCNRCDHSSDPYESWDSENAFHRFVHDECRCRNVFKPGAFWSVPRILPRGGWKTTDHIR